MPSLVEGIVQGLIQGGQLNNEKTEKELNKKRIKLESKLLELQLDLKQGKQSALDEITSKLQGTSPGNVGGADSQFPGQQIPPLQNAGELPEQPKSILDVLSDASLAPLLLESGLATPESLSKNQNTQFNQNLISKMFPGFTDQPTADGSGTVEGQGGITGSGFDQPSLSFGPSGTSIDFKPKKKTDEQLNAEALGLTGKEKNKFIRDSLKMGVSDEQLRQIEINTGIAKNEKSILEIQKLQRESKNEIKTESKEHSKFQNTINKDVSSVFEMAELLDTIEDTAVKTGAADSLRVRGMSILALVNGGDADLVAKAERFNSLSSQLGISMALQMFEGQRMTQGEFKAVVDSLVGSGTQADANRLGMADIVRRILNEEESNPDVSLKDRKKLTELERRLRAGNKTGSFDSKSGSVRNFNAGGEEVR